MRGPGAPKVSTLAVLESFSEEENPDKELNTNVSKRHLITPFRDINADKRCFFLETFHQLRMLTLFLVFSKNAPCCPHNICDFGESRKSLCAWERLWKVVRSVQGRGGAPPHFARNEGTKKTKMKLYLEALNLELSKTLFCVGARYIWRQQLPDA